MTSYPSAPTYPGYGPGPGEYPAMPAMPATPASGVYPASMPMPMPMPSEPPPSSYYPVSPAVPANAMPAFGPESVSMTCPHCGIFITTKTTNTYGCCTHCLCCLMLCSGGLLTLCSCLPYLCCEPDTTFHFCPNCNAKLGVWGSDGC